MEESSEVVSLLEEIQRLRSLGRQSEMMDQLPTEEAALRSAAESLDRIGVHASNAGLLDRAHDAFFLLFVCRLRIVERHPDVRPDIRDFASAEDLLGTVLIDVGNIEGADKLLSEALKYRQSLLHDDPDDAHANYLYGLSLWRMACLHAAKEDLATEANFVRKASTHMALVDGKWPGSHFIETLKRDVDTRWAAIKQRL